MVVMICKIVFKHNLTIRKKKKQNTWDHSMASGSGEARRPSAFRQHTGSRAFSNSWVLDQLQTSQRQQRGQPSPEPVLNHSSRASASSPGHTLADVRLPVKVYTFKGTPVGQPQHRGCHPATWNS